jgi:outer-membrane receptor for ferric coprogen and ferric-rhodotorulic acid
MRRHNNKNMRKLNLLAGAAMVLAMPLFGTGTAHAQTAAQDVKSFDVSAQSLSSALAEFGVQAGIQFTVDAPVMEGKTSGAVKGRMTTTEALARLLAGTGLNFHFVNASNVAIDPAPASATGERVLGAVRVEGSQSSPYFGGAGQAAGVNGVNGSRDITATEGTGSFTSGALTIGSKVAQSMKDVPQSLSVLTSERMQQQNVTDFTSAMRQLPGIATVQNNGGSGTNLDQTFYSRGFAITNFQIDGGAPLSFGGGGSSVNSTTNFNPTLQIDLSQYDHVELVRGAAGTFTGYGSPSGVVNLVRKKPLDHQQLSLELEAGSWNSYRVVLDGTSPITADGKLRSRIVFTFEDKDYFYDIAHSNKKLFYNINEYDLTTTTLLTAGFSLTRQRSIPWQSGLPRYQSGGDLNLPRNTCICFPWNRDVSNTNEFFGSIEQRIGKEWTFKISETYNKYDRLRKLGFNAYGTPVNATDGKGPRLIGSYTLDPYYQNVIEALVNGAFNIFGQRQEVSLGVNQSFSSNNSYGYDELIIGGTPSRPYVPYPGGPAYCYSYDPANPCPVGTVGPQTPLINVFNFNPFADIYNEPKDPLASSKVLSAYNVNSIAYANFRFTAFDRMHLNLGIRWSRFINKSQREFTNFVLPEIYYKNTNFSWPPSGSISFDFTKNLTGYIGYTDIYQDQSIFFKKSGGIIEPITGSNWEAGIKWAPRDGRLNISLSAYSIKQRNFATEDASAIMRDADGNYLGVVDDSGFVWYDQYNRYGDGTHTCCYIANPNKIYISRGVDIDVTGEVMPGWQVAASFSYNKNRFEGSDFGDLQGQPFLTIAPKALPKVWTSYDFGAGGFSGWLSGLTLSAGVLGQSSGYYSGAVCVSPSNVPDPITHQSPCNDDPAKSDDGYQPYAFTTKAYALISARIDYRFSRNLSASLNVENLLDKVYYSAVGDSGGGNWYGAPRSITASLRTKW